MKLTIEQMPGGYGFRLYGAGLNAPVTGSSIENVIARAATAAGVVGEPESLEVNSIYEMAQVLETLMGDKTPEGQIVTGLA